ncbi:MAG: RNA polymerase sigma factor [Verrucomicrobiota bacterium]|jgi:RNA polymerase sigma-70 factor (ECF subfamily)
MDPTDADLVRSAMEGRPEAFEELVRRHQSRLFVLARRHLPDESEAADLVQDILLKAWQHLASWRGDAPFEHWLLRIGVRTCYDHLRSRRRQREPTLSQMSDDETAWLERHGANEEPPSHEAEAARSLVGKVFAQLSPAARLVLTLLEIEDRPVKEIADLTGWSVPLVKVRAFRARAEMRRILQRMGVEKYL